MVAVPGRCYNKEKIGARYEEKDYKGIPNDSYIPKKLQILNYNNNDPKTNNPVL